MIIANGITGLSFKVSERVLIALILGTMGDVRGLFAVAGYKLFPGHVGKDGKK